MPLIPEGRLMRSRAAVGAPQLHEMRLLRVERDGREEAVASEIHQPPATCRELVKSFDLRARDVLGMCARDDDVVAVEERSAFAIEIMVRQRIEFDALRLEPVSNAEIGGEPQTPSAWNHARCLGCIVRMGRRTLPKTTPDPSLCSS